jgi:hypothetical protein
MESIIFQATLILAGILVMAFVFWKLVVWARKRSQGAIATGALFSVFAPDPTFEQSVRLVEEAAQEISEEDPGGEPGRDEN